MSSPVPATPETRDQALRLHTSGPDDTRSLAAVLASALADGDLIVLTGDLGAGKTCFTQGLAAGLGIDEPITSPTFTLANRYQGRLTLHHLDVYRLDSEADAVDLAIEELVEDGVTVIEWGERVAGLLPADRFTVTLGFAELASEQIDDRSGAVDPSLDLRRIDLDGPVVGRGLDRLLARWSEARWSE